MTACEACPAGSANPLTGSQASSACQVCSAGSFQNLPGQANCYPCPAGSSQNATGAQSCDACTPGTFQDQIGSLSCDPCSVGTHQPYSGAASCFDCLPGTYQNLVGQTDCPACPACYYGADCIVAACESTTGNCYTSEPDADSDAISDFCDMCRQVADLSQEDFDMDCPARPYLTDPRCGDACDCDSGNGNVWAGPTVVRNLMISKNIADNIWWNEPSAPGCLLPVYDVLRSLNPADFSSATCLTANVIDRYITDTEEPTTPGVVFFYLVRVENDCPSPGNSNMGTTSAGIPRTGRTCP
jgi:hypothetical protein